MGLGGTRVDIPGGVHGERPHSRAETARGLGCLGRPGRGGRDVEEAARPSPLPRRIEAQRASRDEGRVPPGCQPCKGFGRAQLRKGSQGHCGIGQVDDGEHPVQVVDGDARTHVELQRGGPPGEIVSDQVVQRVQSAWTRTGFDAMTDPHIPSVLGPSRVCGPGRGRRRGTVGVQRPDLDAVTGDAGELAHPPATQRPLHQGQPVVAAGRPPWAKNHLATTVAQPTPPPNWQQNTPHRAQNAANSTGGPVVASCVDEIPPQNQAAALGSITS